MATEAVVVPFERLKPGRQVLMDTGEDSLFGWYVYAPSWDRSPAVVAVHKHDDVDEMIILFGGEGYYLHGPTPEAMVRTPWTAPCVLWMPAGQFHRVVTTSEGANEALLFYSPAGGRIDPFAQTISRATAGGEVPFAALPVVSRQRSPEWLP